MKKQVSGELVSVLSAEIIQSKIYLIRGCKVMLDRDLAELYGVSTGRLKEQVRRNLKRFPSDFMFELSWDEASRFVSRSQFATLKKGQNIKYLPFAFTEQGVAMLSSVLNSNRAIEVNIAIMRAFVKLRVILGANKQLAHKLEELEKRVEKNDKEIVAIFEAIRRLMSDPPKDDAYKRTKIGFIVNKD